MKKNGKIILYDWDRFSVGVNGGVNPRLLFRFSKRCSTRESPRRCLGGVSSGTSGIFFSTDDWQFLKNTEQQSDQCAVQILIRAENMRIKRNHAIEWATCRRWVLDGDEPRDGDRPLSAAAERKSSVESDRVEKRRDGVRTKYWELDIRFWLKRVCVCVFPIGFLSSHQANGILIEKEWLTRF